MSYNGVILLNDAVLSVYNSKTNKNEAITINNFNHRNTNNKLLSDYMGMQNNFHINRTEKSPKDIFMLILNNRKSLLCAAGSKLMVNRESSYELLPIEILEEKIERTEKNTPVYFPYLSDEEQRQSSGIELQYILIESIIKLKNINRSYGYQILFDKDTKSVLMKLKSGFVIRGDKSLEE
jgi:hypothetical protein